MTRWILLLALLLLPSQGWAAITLVGSVDTSISVSDDTTLTGSWTSTTGTNSCLVVQVPQYNGSGTSAGTTGSWGGFTLTRASGTPGGDYVGEIWVAALGASHTGATNTLTINFSGNVYALAIIQQFDGCNQATPTHDGTSTSSSTESGTATLTLANLVTTDYMLGVVMKGDGSNVYTLGTETQLAQLVHPGLTSRRALGMYRTGQTGSVAIDATFTSTFWGMGATALQEAAAGGAETFGFRRRLAP